MYGREDESQESMQKAVQLLRGRGTPPEKPIITAFRDVTGVKRHFVRTFPSAQMQCPYAASSTRARYTTR
jgi:hypothetical protein